LHRQTVTRVLPYAPEQLQALVSDVSRYPEFVPWVIAMRTWNASAPSPGVTQVDAEAEVRFAIVRERFATRVLSDTGARQIDVSLLYGPFKRLSNRWRFLPHPLGTTVEFVIEFEFKSRLLEGLLAANAARGANTVMSCFEARAKKLYGQPSGLQLGLA
jgi:coenzyme Q-binding protein COQ10